MFATEEQHVRNGVKRAAAYALAAHTNQFAGPLQHFLRRFARKGQEQDIRRIDTAIDQIGHAVHQCACFPAARARNHQGGSIARRHRCKLLRI